VSVSQQEFIEIGVVGRPHGVRGEVRVRVHSPDASAFTRAARIFLAKEGADVGADVGADAGAPRPVKVRSARAVGDGFLVAFDGIADRDAAMTLSGATVLARRDELPALREDEIYVADLVGCVVETRAGKPWGQVHDVLPGPAHEILVIREGDVERLLPYVPDFVVAVDLAARRVVVDPPEGLPEEHLGRSPGAKSGARRRL
jgi:16S rRNA processing protein RimM